MSFDVSGIILTLNITLFTCISSLPDDSVSNADYITQNDRIIVNNDFKRM
jgi:hypothetical protein